MAWGDLVYHYPAKSQLPADSGSPQDIVEGVLGFPNNIATSLVWIFIAKIDVIYIKR